MSSQGLPLLSRLSPSKDPDTAPELLALFAARDEFSFASSAYHTAIQSQNSAGIV